MHNYSGTRCPYCGHSNFEIVEDIPNYSYTKLGYLRCSNMNCLKIICSMPFFSITVMLEKINNDIENIKKVLKID